MPAGWELNDDGCLRDSRGHDPIRHVAVVTMDEVLIDLQAPIVDIGVFIGLSRADACMIANTGFGLGTEPEFERSLFEACDVDTLLDADYEYEDEDYEYQHPPAPTVKTPMPDWP